MVVTETRRSAPRVAVVVAAVIVAATALAILLRAELLEFGGRIITRSDPLVPETRYTMLLMGDHTTGRARRALEIASQDPQTTIIIARDEAPDVDLLPELPRWSVSHRRWLLAQGLPESRLIYLEDCDATSTVDEARCARRYLETLTPRPPRINVVTSWFHTSRAGYLFERVLDGSGIAVSVTPASLRDKMHEGWWTNEETFLAVFNEYLKWTFWLVRGVQR